MKDWQATYTKDKAGWMIAVSELTKQRDRHVKRAARLFDEWLGGDLELWSHEIELFSSVFICFQQSLRPKSCRAELRMVRFSQVGEVAGDVSRDGPLSSGAEGAR